MVKNLKDSYKDYKKETYFTGLSYKDYKTIVSLYIKFILAKIYEGHYITLPMKMGTLGVIGVKQKIKYDENGNIKGLAPDWVKTKELREKSEKAMKEKKIIYHVNTYRYRFYWSKKNVTVKYKSLYSLRMSRSNKRNLSRLINNGKNFITKE